MKPKNEMRETKFRAWIEYDKEMVYDVTYRRELEGGVRPWLFMQFIGLQAVKGRAIYVEDITEILAEDGKLNRFVVKSGIVRRTMESGLEVDIPCFYFDLIGGNFKAFPVVRNYQGVHDLSMTKILGNTCQNPDLVKEIEREMRK